MVPILAILGNYHVVLQWSVSEHPNAKKSNSGVACRTSASGAERLAQQDSQIPSRLRPALQLWTLGVDRSVMGRAGLPNEFFSKTVRKVKTRKKTHSAIRNPQAGPSSNRLAVPPIPCLHFANNTIF